MGYLTPDITPTSAACRALFIPNDEQYLAVVRGALQELTFAHNWDKYGTLTPEQAAQNFIDMFDRFCFNEGICRVIGEIIAFAGATSPDSRWLVCDGSSIAIATYPDLYNVIGTTYGAPGAGLFSLPDMRGRSLAGTGTGTGLTAVTLAQQYGEESHVLTTGEIPAHSHTYIPPVLNVDMETPGVPDLIAAGVGIPTNTGDTGGNGAHNTVGPRLGITYLIVARD